MDLDPKSKRELVLLINNLCSVHEPTLIIATHDIDFSQKVAEKSYVLDKGKIIIEDKLSKVLLNSKLMEKVGLF